MKRILAFFLCIVTVFLLCACGAPAEQTPEETTTAPVETEKVIDKATPLCDGKTLKLLVISSSFGLNTTNFLYEVAKDQGCEEIVIGRLFLAECTLKRHVQNAAKNAFAYRYYNVCIGYISENKSFFNFHFCVPRFCIIFQTCCRLCSRLCILRGSL